ncbi:MAG: hypothetical protein JNM10_12805 [Planctomycetia bacterium]|nr:hypothetical protein [Planctomycetia bacterium]
MADAPVHLFGIRHHGPGSARSLRAALERLAPDVVLVEGPPDADELLPGAGHAGLEPPVAILVYAPDTPRHATFYPFARYSPEWVAIRYALERGVPVRFMDLPFAHRPVEADDVPAAEADAPAAEGAGGDPAPGDARPGGSQGPAAGAGPDGPDEPGEAGEAGDAEGADGPGDDGALAGDPLGALARAAGFSDGERWWHHVVEGRRGDDALVFAAVAEAMTALRETPARVPAEEARREARREAFMRKTIRAALKEGFQRVAVVCGAYHVPALAAPTARGVASADAETLADLPRTKTAAVWVPWTYGRLATASGYGAGVPSPAWYDLLWADREGAPVAFAVAAARLLRAEDLDASSAHVIETVRLAEALAALRGYGAVGLDELLDATRSVLCGGDAAPMALVHRRLVVGERLGGVPDDAPTSPLQRDLAAQQKRLRLPASAVEKVHDLDLRQPNDLARSHLLHRLRLLDVPWGEPAGPGAGKGTFHEVWKLVWKPEFALPLVEAGRYGNTIADAAAAVAAERAGSADGLAALTAMLERALLADLPVAVEALVAAVHRRAAVGADAAQLMAALPPLVQVIRYGDVRKTPVTGVDAVVDAMVARIAVGLPSASLSLDDDAAAAMFEHLVATDRALALLARADHLEAWRGALLRVVDLPGVHGVVAGRAFRLLLDAKAFGRDETDRRLRFALSSGVEPAEAGAFLEGLLADSGLLLVHDTALWGHVDAWLADLSPEAFVVALPLLRRTLATFTSAERRQLGDRATRGGPAAGGPRRPGEHDFDEARAARVLPVLATILGVTLPTEARS